jgi:hypothetical protein
LTYREEGKTIWLYFDPGNFFVHLTKAIDEAVIDWDGISFDYLERGSDSYRFTSTALKNAFKRGGIQEQ